MAQKPAQVRLMNKAVDYLSRYTSSRYKLTQILHRFATRKLAGHDPEDINAAIKLTLNQCTKLGYINDRQFAVTNARKQRKLGRSQAVILHGLRQHALDDEIIAQALAEADEDSDNGDLKAAIRFAQRRGLGPFADQARASRQRLNSRQRRQRDLGALTRAGFSMATSKKIIDHNDPDTIEALLD